MIKFDKKNSIKLKRENKLTKESSYIIIHSIAFVYIIIDVLLREFLLIANYNILC